MEEPEEGQQQDAQEEGSGREAPEEFILEERRNRYRSEESLSKEAKEIQLNEDKRLSSEVDVSQKIEPEEDKKIPSEQDSNETLNRSLDRLQDEEKKKLAAITIQRFHRGAVARRKIANSKKSVEIDEEAVSPELEI